jgi:hypothetical protein
VRRPLQDVRRRSAPTDRAAGAPSSDDIDAGRVSGPEGRA